MKRKNTGLALGMVAACSYGTNPLFALPLYAAGMAANSMLFYRYLFAVVLYGLWIYFYKGISLKITKKEAFVLFFLGVVFAISSLTLFVSFQYIGAGIATTILFVYPIIVAVIMAIFFKEKLSHKTIISIFLMIAGIGLLYKNDGGDTSSLFGVVCVLLSALSYAIYIVGVKKINAIRHIKLPKLTFYVMFFGLFVFLINTRMGLDIQGLHTPLMWGSVIGLALFPTIISLETMAVSIKLIGPTLSAVLGALEPVTAIIIGVVLFGEQLTLRIGIGIMLILFSVMLIVVQGKKASR